MLHAGTVQGKTVHDALWQQHEMFQERATQGTQLLRLESTEHVRKGVAKTEHENAGIHQRIVMRTCADSLALPDGFAKLEYPLVSSYPTTIKSSTDCKIQRIG